MHEKTTPCFWYGVNAVTVPWAKVGTKERVDYAREAIGLVFSPGYYKSTIGIYSEIDSERYKSSLKKKHLGR